MAAGQTMANMPANTWGINALSNDMIAHGNAISNTGRQVGGAIEHGVDRDRYDHGDIGQCIERLGRIDRFGRSGSLWNLRTRRRRNACVRHREGRGSKKREA